MRTSIQNAAVLCSVLAIYLLASCASPDAPNKSASPVRLLAPLALDYFTKTGPITRSQAMGLFNEKVKLNSKNADDYAFLVLPAPPQAISNPAAPPALPVVGQRVRVETVAEYLAALKSGAAGLLMACGGAGRTRNA